MARKKISPPTVQVPADQTEKGAFYKAFNELVHLINQKGGAALQRSKSLVDLVGTLVIEHHAALDRAKKAESNITVTVEECTRIVRILENIDALGAFADECEHSNNPQIALSAIRTYVAAIFQMDVDGAREGIFPPSLFVGLSNRLQKAAKEGPEPAPEKD